MIPQSIAYANLAGLPAQYGLYTAFIGSFTYIFFGTIKEVSIGPTTLMSMLTFSYTENLQIDHVILLTFLAGIVELLMGILKLGFLVEFISPSVTSGFTSSMSIVMTVSQLKNLFGIRKLKNHGFIDFIYQIFSRYKEIRIPDTILGIVCIIFLFSFKQLPKIKVQSRIIKKIIWIISISKNIIIVILTTSLAYCWEISEGVSPFTLSGAVPQGLPEFKIPKFYTISNNETVGFTNMVHSLGSSIIVLPVAAVLANVAIAKAFANGVIVDATQEMMTLGFCNILGSFVQALPSCGAFTRSAVASSSDVRTPLQGIYSGTIIIMALSFLTPTFYYIPRTTLGAILISAVVPLFDYEIFPKLWRRNKFDFYLTLITLSMGIFFGLEMGIITGGLLNIVILLKTWARPTITKEIRTDEKGFEYIYIKPEIGLYYPAIDYFSTTITKVHNYAPNLPIIIDFSNIIRVDYSAIEMFENLIQTYTKKQSIILSFINLKPIIYEVLKNDMNRKKFEIINHKNSDKNDMSMTMEFCYGKNDETTILLR